MIAYQPLWVYGVGLGVVCEGDMPGWLRCARDWLGIWVRWAGSTCGGRRGGLCVDGTGNCIITCAIQIAHVPFVLD